MRSSTSAFDPAEYRRVYADFAEQNPLWNQIPAATGQLYEWDPASLYIREPPYFDPSMAAAPSAEFSGARALAIFGDSITTDHISPAGAIKPTSPAGDYLRDRGVPVEDFNSYGARRGNHEVMVRGTFANVRIRNLMVPGVEGGITSHQPDGEQHGHLRRSRALPRRGRAADRDRRAGLRSGQLARLGRQGHTPARRARGDCPWIRADPPLQSDRHGRLALPASRRE